MMRLLIYTKNSSKIWLVAITVQADDKGKKTCAAASYERTASSTIFGVFKFDMSWLHARFSLRRISIESAHPFRKGIVYSAYSAELIGMHHLASHWSCSRSISVCCTKFDLVIGL